MTLVRSIGFISGFALLAIGILLRPFDWPILAPYAQELLFVGTGLLLTGWIISRTTKLSLASSLLGAGLTGFGLFHAGPIVMLSTLLVLAGGLGIGTLVDDSHRCHPLVRWTAGLGILAATLGWLLPFPIHYAAVWAPVLLATCWWRRHKIGADLIQLHTEWRSSTVSAPHSTWIFAIVFLLASRPAWLPVRNPDDLAYRLGLAWELIRHGHGQLDLGAQAWALAPWSTDLLHSLVMLVAGTEATGPLNVFWLLLASILVQRIGLALGLNEQQSWLSAMLYASLPLSGFLSSSMQPESATPAMVAAISLILIDRKRIDGQQLRLIAVVAGFMLASKMSNALMLLPFAAWLILRWNRDITAKSLLVATILGLFTGASSYVYAFGLAGNPVLPMLNGVFGSPWYPAENFVDATWQSGVPWNLPWELTIDTGEYFEGNAGAAGLFVLALFGGFFTALADRNLRVPIAVGLTSALLMFWQVQYLRYLHPTFTLIIPTLVAGLLHGSPRIAWKEWLLSALVFGQLFLLPTASWMFGQDALRLNTTQGPESVLDKFVPERKISERFLSRARPTDRVLFTDPRRSFTAEYAGTAMGVAWFTPFTSSAIAEGNPSDWSGVVARAGANYLMTYNAAKSAGLSAYLKQSNAILEDENGAAELYRIPLLAIPFTRDEDRAEGKIDLIVPIQRSYPVAGDIQVILGCDQWGEMIATGWTLTGLQDQSTNHWHWISCGIDGRAIAQVTYMSMARSKNIRFTASTALPESGMRVELLSVEGDVRRNLPQETALYHRLWDSLCFKDKCLHEHMKIAPVEGIE